MHAVRALNKKRFTQRSAIHSFFAVKQAPSNNKLPFIAKAFNLSENSVYSAQMNAFNHLKIEFNAQKISKQAILDKLLALEEATDFDFDFNGCSVFSDSHSLTLIIYDKNAEDFLSQIDSLYRETNLSV